jgi:hypothetical protein
MTDTTSMTVRTPWHLWVVGILSLLWNAIGPIDFVMTLTQGETWLRMVGMNDAQIAYFNAMPQWMYVFWFIGVFGAIGGSILLLLRRKWAVHVWALSLVGAAMNLVYCFLLSNGQEVMGDKIWMSLIIPVVALLLLWYAWMMSRRGVLR